MSKRSAGGSNERLPVSSPSDGSRLVLIIGVVLTFFVSAWIAHQQSLGLPYPGTLAGAIMIVLTCSWPVALLWAAGWGYGSIIRRLLCLGRRHPWLYQAVGGLAMLLWLWHSLSIAGLMVQATAEALIAGGLLLAGIDAVLLARGPIGTWRDKIGGVGLAGNENESAGMGGAWTLTLLMPGLAMLTIAATCPPGTLWRVEALGYDVLSYHLQLPRQWIELGSLAPVQGNIYSHLPSLIESGFALIQLLSPDQNTTIYAAQLWQVTMALAAAIGTYALARLVVDRWCALFAAAIVINLPWTIITGSLAYNDISMLAFGVVGCCAAMDVNTQTRRTMLLAGGMLGLAILAKPSSAIMLAMPVGILVLIRLNHVLRWRPSPTITRTLVSAAILTLASLVTMSPWMLRQTIHTGNPVFPLMTQTLGGDGRDRQLMERWQRAHDASFSYDSRLGAIWTQWLGNTGYAAVGGIETVSTGEAARFTQQGGAPVLWFEMLLLAILAMIGITTRRMAVAMLLVLMLQVTAWLLLTHLQSRFLLPTVVPAAVCLAMGLARFRSRGRLRHVLAAIVALTMTLVMVTVSLSTLWDQAGTGPDSSSPVPIGLISDSLTPPSGPGDNPADAVLPGDHPINALPRDAMVLIVADNGSLLYIQRKIVYATPFDPDPLTDVVRQVGQDPDAIAAELRRRGFTHVWLGHSERSRIAASYGSDDAVTFDTLLRCARAWPVVYVYGKYASLHRL